MTKYKKQIVKRPLRKKKNKYIKLSYTKPKISRDDINKLLFNRFDKYSKEIKNIKKNINKPIRVSTSRQYKQPTDKIDKREDLYKMLKKDAALNLDKKMTKTEIVEEVKKAIKEGEEGKKLKQDLDIIKEPIRKNKLFIEHEKEKEKLFDIKNNKKKVTNDLEKLQNFTIKNHENDVQKFKIDDNKFKEELNNKQKLVEEKYNNELNELKNIITEETNNLDKIKINEITKITKDKIKIDNISKRNGDLKNLQNYNGDIYKIIIDDVKYKAKKLRKIINTYDNGDKIIIKTDNSAIYSIDNDQDLIYDILKAEKNYVEHVDDKQELEKNKINEIKNIENEYNEFVTKQTQQLNKQEKNINDSLTQLKKQMVEIEIDEATTQKNLIELDDKIKQLNKLNDAIQDIEKGNGDNVNEYNNDGVYMDTIDNIMNPYVDNENIEYPYIGTLSYNEFMEYINDVFEIDDPFSCIVLLNNDNNNDVGHYISILYKPYISLYIYDSFGSKNDNKYNIKQIENITDEFKKKFKDSDTMIKYKYNTIQQQDNKSDNCAWYCIRTILCMNYGVPFSKITGYDDINTLEINAENMQNNWEQFGYI